MEHGTRNKREKQEGRAPSARPSWKKNAPCSTLHVQCSRGVSLVEVVVSIAILMMAVTGLLVTYGIFVKAGLRTLGTVQAAYLLEEGAEAAGLLRDYGWAANIASLTNGVKYYFYWDGGRWVATTTVSKIDSTYDRYFTLDAVMRDANDNIAASGSADSGSRKVTVSVSWLADATTTTRSVSMYLTNLFNN